MKSLILTIILSFFTLFTFNQELHAQRNVEEVKIQTSALCGTCEKIIMEALAFKSGVRSASIDLESAILTVNYNQRRTSPENIRKTISKVGYDADDVKADKEAYAKLPFCCRIESGVH